MLTGLIVVCFSSMSQSTKVLSLIPAPVSIKQESGNFVLTGQTSIEVSSSDLSALGKYLAEQLAPATGFSNKVNTVSSFSNASIQLRLSGKPGKNKDAYELKVTPSAVTITADSSEGIYYGIQTLLQLLQN